MKVIFTNPPFIRSKNSCAENNFKISWWIIYNHKFWSHIPYGRLIFNWLVKYLKIWWSIRYGIRAGSRWPWTSEFPIGPFQYPFFMWYAVSFLKDKWYDVEMIDAVAEHQYNYLKYIEDIKSRKPDIVVIETSTPTRDIDIYIAEKFSEFTDVCLCWPHASINAEEIKREYPFVKYILKWEYILNSWEMLKTKKEWIYESELVKDFDKIPYPFRDYPEAIEYYEPTMPTARPQLQIYWSKGCPFHCVYCMRPQTMYQKMYMPRSPKAIAAEIRHCIKKYGYKSILFDDDTFNIWNDRMSELCDELKEIWLPRTMMGRLDTSPVELFDKMVDSGCVWMRFWIETFDPKVSKNIKKWLIAENVKEKITYLSQKYPNLYLHVTMMKDLPWQSDEIHKKDMKILKELWFSIYNLKRSYQLASCAPFPWTELYDTLKEKYWEELVNNRQNYDGWQSTIMKNLKF